MATYHSIAEALGSAPDALAPRLLHRVEVLATQILIGTTVRVAGDIIEVDEDRARAMHADTSGRVIDRGRIRDLADPPPARGAAHSDPFPGDPRLSVKVIRGTPVWMGTVHRKGDLVELPERVAIQWAEAGAAQIVRGQTLSAAGMRYQAELKGRSFGSVKYA